MAGCCLAALYLPHLVTEVFLSSGSSSTTRGSPASESSTVSLIISHNVILFASLCCLSPTATQRQERRNNNENSARKFQRFKINVEDHKSRLVGKGSHTAIGRSNYRSMG